MLHVRYATATDIDLIRDITFGVWPQAYSPILSIEQIDYMLEMMYSQSSLIHQLNELNHRFIICYNDDIACGFASYSVMQNEVYKLHKLYVAVSAQGTGAGKFLLQKVCNDIQNMNGKALTLNVNRNNPAVQFYTKLGFTIISEEDIDIGNGFFMNDYVMEKAIRK